VAWRGKIEEDNGNLEEKIKRWKSLKNKGKKVVARGAGQRCGGRGCNCHVKDE